MSYPYPQDRHRDRKEKGEIEYREARQAMAGAEERQVAEAEFYGEQRSGDEPDVAGIEENLEAAAREVHQSIPDEGDGAKV